MEKIYLFRTDNTRIPTTTVRMMFCEEPPIASRPCLFKTRNLYREKLLVSTEKEIITYKGSCSSRAKIASFSFSLYLKTIENSIEKVSSNDYSLFQEIVIDFFTNVKKRISNAKKKTTSTISKSFFWRVEI